MFPVSSPHHDDGTAGPRTDPPQRPLLTLERMLEDLGSTFLAPLAEVPEPTRRVTGVSVYDPLDDMLVSPGLVVLGVGLSEGPDLVGVLREMALGGASALILREPVALEAATAELAGAHGVALLGLTRGASWTQLSSMIYSLLAEPAITSESETIDGLPSGDLFAVANAISSLLDAPVTIEDRNSRVLAFSSRQDEADSPRIETILERQVPEPYLRMLMESGFFERLYSSEEPVYIQLTSDDTEIKGRVAIAVRAGGEILGSIWAAVPETFSPEQMAVFRDVSKVVALHLLRLRAGANVDRRLRADLLSTALEGGDGADYALERLGIDDSPIAVFAAGVLGLRTRKADAAIERQRVADAVVVHLAAVHPAACVALLGDTIFGVLPVQSMEAGEAHALRLADDILARVGRRTPLAMGIGPIVSSSRELLTAREGARRALRVRMEQGDSESSVALFSRVHVEALLLELRDRVAAGKTTVTGPVARLWAHDQVHDTQFIETLRSWLDCMGDVSAAADMLHVHPNTLRYRLRRLAEIGDMDLGDPEARFAAQLLLRIAPELSAPASQE